MANTQATASSEVADVSLYSIFIRAHPCNPWSILLFLPTDYTDWHGFKDDKFTLRRKR